MLGIPGSLDSGLFNPLTPKTFSASFEEYLNIVRLVSEVICSMSWLEFLLHFKQNNKTKTSMLVRPYDLTEGPQAEVTSGLSNHKITPKDLEEVLDPQAGNRRQTALKVCHTLLGAELLQKQYWSLTPEAS